MKKFFAATFLVFFSLSISEALPRAAHAFIEVKCPKCKMKIEKKGACPCCHKKKPVGRAYIYDPCADEDGDYAIQFDRVNAVAPSIVELPPQFILAFIDIPIRSMASLTLETASPPPRR